MSVDRRQKQRRSARRDGAGQGRARRTHPRGPQAGPESPLQIIPLGGLGEIGKNATLIQWQQDALLVDAGLRFPEEELLGIDLVIPDFGLIAERKLRFHGVVLTHGHEDHIGALTYLAQRLQTVVAGTPLTLGLARGKFEEQEKQPAWRSLNYREEAALGPFRIELIRVSHSIPDSASVLVRAPTATVVVSGDFKFDQTPVDGRPTDMARLAEVGEQGVDALLLDSTNSERPGYTPSERNVGAALLPFFEQARGRIIVTTFASNVHRLQQVIDLAQRTGRRLAVVGRSMETTVRIARELGHLQIKKGLLVPPDEVSRQPEGQLAILITGSQGEPLSALSRMAAGEHRRLSVKPGDTVIFSASAIPGNEGLVAQTIDNLFRRGAEVIYGAVAQVHVSGHAAAEELKLMTNLLRPHTFIPVHGEYRMLVQNTRLAGQLGYDRGRILLGENGTVFEIGHDVGRISGRIAAGNVLVDGLGVGDVGGVVLRDRQHLARDGMVIVLVALDRNSGEVVSGPDIVSRGFVYMREAEELVAEVRARVGAVIQRLRRAHATDWGAVKHTIRDDLGRFLYERTGRRPMVLPMVVEV